MQAAEVIMTSLGSMSISVMDGISALIDKSILQQPQYGTDEARLYLFELIREYGLESLAACGELERTRDAHAAYFLELVDVAMFDTEQNAWEELLEREKDNLRAAMEWLLDSGKIEEA